ncbi:MAG: hypothetical protein KFF77_12155 [Bacteroidetes bacterium]|nr:hypothetical protein [Bacteroidota bacterium]
MNKPFRVLIAAVLFVSLSGLALAQEGKDLDAFLGDDSPALLFQVDQLSLGNWNGGIGMMFSSGSTMHWRFALHPRFSDSGSDLTDSLGTNVDDESSAYGMGISISPFWVVSKTTDFFITAGVTGFYRYTSESTINRRRYNPPYIERNFNEQYFSIGGNMGVGWAVSSAIALHGEYHLGVGARVTSTEELVGTEGGMLNKSEWTSDGISLGYSATLSLLVRL